jgi:hypothetical protein
MVGGGWLADQVSIGVLAAQVPRDVVDEAVAAAGKRARRRDGKLPPHVMVYFAMAMALFADDDYEEVAARLAGTLGSWGCWDGSWGVPTSGGITQARQRLGHEPLQEVFARVAVPVAGPLTAGAFLGGWRLMAVDGFEWDVPDTKENAAEFGYAGTAAGQQPAFPKARVVTISECGSHAMVDTQIAGIAGKGGGEQALARRMYPRLEEDWLLIADRNFYSFADWRAASARADLLWRVKSSLDLPVLEALPDGSYLSVLTRPHAAPAIRQQLIQAAAAGRDLDGETAIRVRVIEYDVPDREGRGKGELITLITTITDPAAVPAAALAAAYHQRWEHETGNDQIKTHLRGPGRILRSKSPGMARQEIYGYLLAHYAISALICQAADEAGIDPDRVKFTRTVRIIRRQVTSAAAFPP